uniref:hypothetical protein n=1 Tax=Streptomyces niveiscabiei TaxID=164115 RepID=UPI0038F71BC3
LFTIRKVCAGQSFSVFEFLDGGFLILGFADQAGQGIDLPFGFIGDRDIPFREGVFGRAAERTGLAVFQFCPVIFKFRNFGQEGH